MRKEPIVKDAVSGCDTTALVADLAVRGVRVPQTEVLSDIRVIDTDIQSYIHLSPINVLANAEKDKEKYGAACNERRAIFIPLCVSVDGMMGREANRFIQHLADHLAYTQEKNYSTVICWLRTRLSFAILRATILCL